MPRSSLRRTSPGRQTKRQPRDFRSKPLAECTRAERNVRWIEKFCRIPEGPQVGQPVRLRDWQVADLRKIYDNPAGTRRAILSFGRKNAKTTLVAFITLLHLCGFEARTNGHLYSAAQSRDQAAILFGLAAKCVRLSPDLLPFIQVRDGVKQLFCPGLGTLYKALSAEAATAYGLSPSLIVHDELGQVRGPKSELYEALETATASADRPLSIIISTQAPNPDDLLSVLIDDALAGQDPRVVVSLYTAPLEDDPFAEATIRKANPAFGDFQSAAEVLAMAEDARRMPSREPEYRNLVLNQRVEMHSPFVSRAIWAACGGPVAPRFEGPVYVGLDLSSVADLTAKVLISPVADQWHVRPTFWLPLEGIATRAKQDRVPYDLWVRQKHLETTPGKTVEYEFVAQNLFDDCRRMDVRKIAFDRWGFKHLKPWLIRAGFREEQVDGDKAIFEPFGQGYQSMSPALRDLEAALLDGRIAHGNHPVLTMCAANATVSSDPAGNRKLNKVKASGRIDGMVALAMAAGVAGIFDGLPRDKPKAYQMLFV